MIVPWLVSARLARSKLHKCIKRLPVTSLGFDDPVNRCLEQNTVRAFHLHDEKYKLESLLKIKISHSYRQLRHEAIFYKHNAFWIAFDFSCLCSSWTTSQPRRHVIINFMRGGRGKWTFSKADRKDKRS